MLENIYQENYLFNDYNKYICLINKIKFIFIIINIFILYFNNIFIQNNFPFNKIKLVEIIVSNISDQLKEEFNNIIPRIDINNINYIPTIYELFTSRRLYINNKNITNEYILNLRGKTLINEDKNNETIYEDVNLNDIKDIINNNKTFKMNWLDYYNFCNNHKLLDNKTYNSFNDPYISIIVPSFNKQKDLLKSIRSIQNQSFKNIEIIIVDDCSTDNSSYIFKYLLETEPRIRIFTHLENMGCWRSRLDGFLYSRGKYVIHFDAGDLYADNLILEDSYNLVLKYNLDSLRFSFKASDNKLIIETFHWNLTFNKNDEGIKYGSRTYDVTLFEYGTIWNRLIKANILTKSLYILDLCILNAYKNLWEDRWWNILTNYMSFSNLIINRIGYIYLPTIDGQGRLKIENEIEKDKTIHEIIYFWLFDLQLLPKEDNKKKIIKQIHYFNRKTNKYLGTKINLSFIKTNFKILAYLLKLLINDPFIDKKDKNFIKKILYKYCRY